MLFKKTDLGDYEAVIDGVGFVCESADKDTESRARAVAKAYHERFEELADFMLAEGLSEVYGEMTAEKLKKALGKPVIDLGADTISYLDHKLDDDHIIEVEFDGELDEFLYLSIDG